MVCLQIAYFLYCMKKRLLTTKAVTSLFGRLVCKFQHELRNVKSYLVILTKNVLANLQNAFLPPQKKAKKGISQKAYFF